MAIKIIKDQAGTVAKVEGIDVNPIPLNSYSCGITASNGGITIFNPNAPNEQGNATKIFNNVHFTEFIKSDGSVPTSAEDLKNDIDLQLTQFAPIDVSSGYEGLWDASTNTPNLTGVFNSGDWFYVGVAGTYNSVEYKLNSIIKYNGASFDLIENPNLRIDDVVGSALSEYDVYVDSEYLGSVFTGSSLQPFTDVASAISSATDGDSILIEGEHIISSELTLPSDKSLYLYGTDKTIIKYANYVSTNGAIINQSSSSSTKEYYFDNINFANAGGYGVYVRSAKEVRFNNCNFFNNGWSGNGLSTILAESGSTLGYDSSQADLQAFWASSETSNGGAMRIRSTNIVSVVDCEVYNNLRGLRIQDCGIGGYGYISRNQCYNNIESGIYLASDSYNATNGCENFTVYNNASKYNSNNGVLVIGGINNVVSLNIIEGNWNAGVMGWHVSNTRFRDLDLTNNNRSQYNGIGNAGDAHSSITIGGDTARSERGYIASVLSCEVYNTGLGSNTSRIGFQVLQDVEDVTGGYEKNLINIDDSGFHKQDYSVDVLADLDSVKLTIGDCRYIDTIETNINIASGSYYEQPFSNHITNLKECDFSVDGESVILKEGVNGVRLNPYTLHDLQANLIGSNINIILKGSEKIQFNLNVSGVSIDGVLLTGTEQEKVNEINALLQHSGSSTGEAPTITSSLAVTMEQGSTLNYELTADYGVAYEWDLSNVSGITTVEGHTRKLIGGSSLVSGTYNIPVKAINYNGEDSDVLVLTVDAPDFSNTKSIQFQQNDYLSGAVSEVNNVFGRASNGDGNSWTISTYFKAGSHNNSVQTIMFAGGNNASSNPSVLLYWDGNHAGRQSIGIRYGSSYNFIKKLTPQNTVSNDGAWHHIMVTFDGGTTGNQSGQLSQYYSRFKVFLDGVQQNTTNSHAAFGNASAFNINIFRIGRWGKASSTLRNSCKVDELAFWDSDQSGNISDIYNNGSPFDLSSLTNQPLNWWRMGDDDTYPTITDNSGSTDLQMNSMTAADIVNDVP